MMTITFSRRLAIVAGVVLPLAATARRWNQLGELRIWLVWLDDVVIAAFLLYGAWRTRDDVAGGRHVLAAAWGFACGLGYASFAFSMLNPTAVDPSGVSMRSVAAVKGVMLLIGLAGLIGSLHQTRATIGERV